jgi:hypothetical protein
MTLRRFATLASQFGLRDVIAFSPSRNGWPDSGDEVAAKLGLDLKVIDRRTWCSNGASPEHLFISADAKGRTFSSTARASCSKAGPCSPVFPATCYGIGTFRNS